MFKCEKCNREFGSSRSYAGHMSSHNRGESYKAKRQTKNTKQKELEKSKPKKCKYCNKEFSNGQSKAGHQTHCKMNPNRRLIGEKISNSLKGKELSKSHKESISESMKLAHEENRAWNIGKSRWNNEPSYPEKFFIEVIENEFNDKDYDREFPIGIYSIDFAWKHKKLAIEIDGDQHQRFEEIIERDKRKDKFLSDNDWKVLRIKWKDLYNDTKNWIKIAKEFIN